MIITMLLQLGNYMPINGGYLQDIQKMQVLSGKHMHGCKFENKKLKLANHTRFT